MRILFSSTRGMGHFQPLLPYAKALQSLGHEVRVAGPSDLKAPLLAAGLEHAPFAHPGNKGLAPLWAKLRQAPEEKRLELTVKELFAGECARSALPSLLQHSRDWQPQLIVRDSIEFAALAVAEKLSIPHLRIAVHQIEMEQGLISFASDPVDDLRSLAGIEPDAGASLLTEPSFTSFPLSFEGTGTNTVTPPFRVRPPKSTPPEANSPWASSEDDLPLVYISFGTVASGSQDALKAYRCAVEAIEELPVRALLTTGRGFDFAQLGTIPSNLQVETWIPQAEILPHTSLVLCHGGSGTLLGALAAGLPLVVLPLGADQPHNAKRVAEVGAGVHVPEANTPALRAGIERILDDDSYAQTARLIASELESLPSLSEAATAMLKFAR